MSSQPFFWFIVVFAILIALFMWVGRHRRKNPSKLNFNGDKPVKASPGSKQAPAVAESETRTLNVIFIYNSHSFDAHEVLGVPAGAKLEQVRIAYHKALHSADIESRPCIEAAYQAILAKING